VPDRSAFANLGFPALVSAVAALACLGGSVMYFRIGDAYAGVGMVLSGIWMGVLGWLYALRTDADAESGDAPSRSQRLRKVAIAILLACMLAQAVAFHYSPNVDL
jgi:NADH:ubiquinone oxidoreductase subunit 4 (subunit M)